VLPDPSLIAKLRDDFPIAEQQDWVPLCGGQTNQLWRVGDLVVKRYSYDHGNPLFPNDPVHEVTILRHLQGLDVAQDLLGKVVHGKQTFLVLRHLRGRSWCKGTAKVARLLRRVHATPPPEGLRQLPGGSLAVARQVDTILARLPVLVQKRLIDLRPGTGVVAAHASQALLHGDPVPGNIIVTPNGPRLIDWQCPAIGDPVEDLALFLSPSMQLIYRGEPLNRSEISAFISAYQDAPTLRRLHAMRPWHHWAMAAYCTWKATQGSAIYARAVGLELTALKQCLNCDDAAATDQDAKQSP
jgi:aminoglycoside phosphotransferase (APT) family kinase protein